MKKLVKAVLVIIAVLGFLFVLAYAALVSTGIPTKGEKIALYEKPRKALLVIDVQEDFTGTSAGEKSPYEDAGPVISSINNAIADAVKKGYPVIYIRQEFSGWGELISRTIMNGKALKGSAGARTDDRILKVSDNDFSKGRADAFSNPALGEFLVANHVNELYLSGLDAEFCVHSTARGALNRGYAVNMLTDSLLLSRKNKWNGLLEQYRKEGIRLVKSGELR